MFRGAICVGERCVFVFAGGDGHCVCVFVCVCVCVYLCLRSVEAAGKGGRLSLSDQVDRRSLIRAREL